MTPLIDSPVPGTWYRVEDGHPPTAEPILVWVNGEWYDGAWWQHRNAYMASTGHEDYEVVTPTHWMFPGAPNA